MGCDRAGMAKANYSVWAVHHVPACVAESGNEVLMLLQFLCPFVRVV